MITTATWTATYTTASGEQASTQCFGADEARIRAELVTSRGAVADSITLTRGADEHTGPGWSRAGALAGHGRGECDNCGSSGSAHGRTDAAGIAGRVCGRCADQPAEQLAFS